MANQKIRCAIYTRKSSEDGLDQDFNSLDAQYEACAAYIASQKHEGWRLVKTRYDDGGLSGGTLERPGLKALLTDIEAGHVDRIIVYKIDRLTRSLPDFSRIVDVLEAKGASFVSVTQSFNTATSMGRLTLNMLLSFAQFEREVTAERIRDKIAASKRKGLWMGGLAPLGYDPHPDKTVRGLVVHPEEATQVRRIFALYRELGTLSRVRDAASSEGICSKRRVFTSGKTTGGNTLSNGQLHHILTNPIYIGKIRHKTDIYEGQHTAIIDQGMWDEVQAALQTAALRKRGVTPLRSNHPAWLLGKMFDETGDHLTPSHTSSKGLTRHYYISNRLIKIGSDPAAWRLSAKRIEGAVREIVSQHLKDRATSNTLIKTPDINAVQMAQRTAAILAERVLSEPTGATLSELIKRVDLQKDQIKVTLYPHVLAETLDLSEDSLMPEALGVETALQLRRRGVEQRLIIGDFSPEPDVKLATLLARAHHWVNALKTGISLKDIAMRDKTSPAYIRARLPLACLAPDLQRRILTGDHPAHWCVEYFKCANIPTDWQEQRKIFLAEI